MSNRLPLSRKQLWRRQHSVPRGPNDFFYREGLDKSFHLLAPVRTVSEPVVNSTASQFYGRAWSTTGDLSIDGSIKSTQNHPPTKRNVKFHTAVRVVLIPTREDYRSAGLGDVMWWSDDSYSEFKNAAKSELRELMIKFIDQSMTSKQAIQILYQPGDEENEKLAAEIEEIMNSRQQPQCQPLSIDDDDSQEEIEVEKMSQEEGSNDIKESESESDKVVSPKIIKTEKERNLTSTMSPSCVLTKRHSFSSPSKPSSTTLPHGGKTVSLDDIEVDGLLKARTDIDLIQRRLLLQKLFNYSCSDNTNTISSVSGDFEKNNLSFISPLEKMVM